jgi:predicted DNA-binding ribbon-helix-helix protein
MAAKKKRMLESVLSQRTLKTDGFRLKLVFENSFWDGLEEIAEEMNCSVEELVQRMYRWGAGDDFVSEVRVYVLRHYWRKLIDAGVTDVHI